MMSTFFSACLHCCLSIYKAWLKNGGPRPAATGLGQLMEAEAGNLTVCTPCCSQVGFRLYEATGSRPRGGEAQSEVPGQLLELALGPQACMETEDGRF